MTHIENRRTGLLVSAALLFVVGCGDDAGGLLGDGGVPNIPGGGVTDNPVFQGIAEACGIDLDCEGRGLLEGNASISGVAEVDTFFQSVLNFQTTADAVSAGIDGEVRAIAAGFGVAGEADLAAAIEAKISASVDGGLRIVAEEPKCQVDAQATLEAQAKCDASIDPGSAMVACSGSCEVEASAEVSCDANAELRCTVIPPMGECSGECSGRCEVELMAAAACEGTCRGECSGECSLEDGDGNCQGTCDGMCSGSCEAAISGGATCEGTCRGECTITAPEAGCEGAIRAECRAMGNAMVMCQGKCEGEFEPPSAKAECEASAKADASLNVECTPPRVAIDYELNANLDAEARAEFLAGIKNLEVRLPSLLAKLERASAVIDAGEGLVTSGSAAVQSSVETAAAAAVEGDLRAAFGLRCALGELGNVASAIGGSSQDLSASVQSATGVTTAIGMP